MAYSVCSRTGQHIRAGSLENPRTFYPQNSSLCRDLVSIEPDSDQPLDFSKKPSSSYEGKRQATADLPNLVRKPSEIYRPHADVDRSSSPSPKRTTPQMPLLPQLLTSSRLPLPQPSVKDKSTRSFFPVPERGGHVSSDVTSPNAHPPNSSPKRPMYDEALPIPVQNVPARDVGFESTPASAPVLSLMPRRESVISERSRSVSSTPSLLSAVSATGFADSCFPHTNGFAFGPKGFDKSGLLVNSGGILRTVLEPNAQRESTGDKKATKVTRPFKAYNPLPNPFPSGLPILPMGIMQDFEDQEYRYQRYVEQYYASRALEAKKPKTDPKAPNHESHPSENGTSEERRESPSTSGTTDSSPTQNYSQSTEIGEDSNSSDSRTQQAADTSTSQNARSSGGKRGGRSLPDEYKDAAYWERRRKNNEAAKRSRDTRRQKEDFIAMRARFLEDENKNLRLTVAFLRQELNTIKCCAAHSHNRF